MVRLGKVNQQTLREIAQSDITRLIVDIADEISEELITSTPVDTGRARSNWLVNLDSPRTDVAVPKSESNAIKTNRVILDRFRTLFANRKQFREIKIHITNNLRYIQGLNEGASRQAPANFVEDSAEVGAIKAARNFKGS